MMEVIIDKKTNIEKEKLIIKALESSIIEDKNRNDYKSIKYHTIALKKHKKFLEQLKEKEELEYVC